MCTVLDQLVDSHISLCTLFNNVRHKMEKSFTDFMWKPKCLSYHTEMYTE